MSCEPYDSAAVAVPAKSVRGVSSKLYSKDFNRILAVSTIPSNLLDPIPPHPIVSTQLLLPLRSSPTTAVVITEGETTT